MANVLKINKLIGAIANICNTYCTEHNEKLKLLEAKSIIFAISSSGSPMFTDILSKCLTQVNIDKDNITPNDITSAIDQLVPSIEDKQLINGILLKLSPIDYRKLLMYVKEIINNL